jgi:alkaline phosphatase D
MIGADAMQQRHIDTTNARPRFLLRLAANLLSLPLILASVVTAAAEAPLTRIAIGSCADQEHEQPVWQAINRDRPELFIFLGDNIYGDTEDMDVMRAKYAQLGNNPGFVELNEYAKVIATWDDHDFGINDGGAEYPMKEASKQVFLDFWKEPADSVRRSQSTGIYTAYTHGPPGKRVQVILLDLRWNRTPLATVPTQEAYDERVAQLMGPYVPVSDPNAVFLGEAQWRWLEQQLAVPAEIRLVGSSLQVLPEFTGWEAWANFPQARERLFAAIGNANGGRTFLLSGDTHWSEFSRVDGAVPYPLWEMTSSGLTEEWKDVSPNRHRVGDFYNLANYGLIEIDWESAEPTLTFSIRDVDGKTVLRQDIPIRP